MISVRAAGDAGLLLNTGHEPTTPQDGNGAAAIAAVIRAAALRGIVDVVPGAATVLVTIEPGSWVLADLAARLTELASAAAASRMAETAEAVPIDVCYDGPDLSDVAALTGLSVAEVIARHQAADYRVGWLGFAPGFAYLTGMDERLAAVPRLDSPRHRVPAGSVAIAGGLTAVYPAASPGGWQLLGRTTAPLWDPDRAQPALLLPGARVRFRAVGSLPVRPGEPAPDPIIATAASAGPRRVEVLQPGPLTTIQDLGRAGLAHLGVPASGAADASSLRLANHLVGNEPGAACLETTLGRLTLRFEADAVVAVTGAPAPVRVDGDEFAPGMAFLVAAGSVLRLGAPPAGVRSYLAVDGGIGGMPVLGSRSADSLSGLGPRALRPGDVLPLGRPRSQQKEDRPTRRRAAVPAAAPLRGSPPPVSPPPASPVLASTAELRAVAGPRDDWFDAAALDALAGGGYVVSPASNRTGLRLTGPALRRGRPGELLSEGIAAGSIQVTHEGQPILLLADRPATGGYPVIAVVVSADLGVAAQLRPGQRVRFIVSDGDAWPRPAS